MNICCNTDYVWLIDVTNYATYLLYSFIAYIYVLPCSEIVVDPSIEELKICGGIAHIISNRSSQQDNINI